MIFRDWSYKQKNRALGIVSVLVLLLSWYLAFGKTFALIGTYRTLEKNLAQSETSAVDSKLLRDKLLRQDSLLQPYRADSAIWTSNLLSQVGTVLSTQAVGVRFENKAVGVQQQTVERDLTLNGSFLQLQQALRILEKDFFVKSIRAEVAKEELRYTVRLVVLKDTVN